MRFTRQPLVAGTLVLLAAGIGATAAITSRTAPTVPPAAQPAAGPAAVAAPGGSTTTTPSTTSTTTSTPRDGAKAVAVAREFLARELGMTNLAATPFRLTDARTGEVGFRHRFGEGGRVLPQTGPPAVVVRLYRLPAGWWVLGVAGRSIQVDGPVRLQRISSPLTVTGKASAYEGTVSVKVTQDRPGRDLVLGQGFVTGSGDANLGPFSGRIDFRRPTAEAGWVIFYEESSATGGGIVQATAVRVRFAVPAPAPRILTVTTSPHLRKLGGDWLELPKGAGTVQLSVKALNADRVRFVLTPTGTGTAPYARLLGEDRDDRDGFTLTWHYGAGDAPSAHLAIQAVGPGGTAEELLGIAHPA
jgi:Immunoglobulin-like domain of bacterial spore germination